LDFTAGANLMQLKQAVNELFLKKDETNQLKLRRASLQKKIRKEVRHNNKI
jgi:hypothetical protein